MTPIVRRLAFVMFAAAVAAPLAAQDAGLAVGTVAPKVAAETIDGRPAHLDQWIGKQPVVLEFWAAWCGNCKQLEPKFAAAIRKYGAQVTFVGVAVAINQTPTRVKAHLEQHPMAMTWLYDRRGDVSGAYETPATSYVVVIDKAGKVVYTGVGGDQDIDAAVRKALN
jgi:thiol-disulfide isomerase/thioredoxin